VIFPEGGIPPTDVIWPVRHGALEVAAAADRPALAVGLVYDQPGARWCEESLWAAIFRVQSLSRPMVAAVVRGPSFDPDELRAGGVEAAAVRIRDFYSEATGFELGTPTVEHRIEPVD
jgi:hypothetical protein